MAEIFPFPALRYHSARYPLSSLVTQPYDKITPAMQEHYYAASPFNLVRVILGKPQPNDDGQHNVYSRAAADFSNWRRQAVLKQDREPSFYVYRQHFSPPGKTEPVLERCGLIATGRLYDYVEGVVFRHEHTLAAPKADRLNLLRATRAHFGQLFMLYSDPQHRVDQLLSRATASDPLARVGDEYGVLNQLWRVSEPDIIRQIQALMSDKQLLIADGHHRYETALAYRNERRNGSGADRSAPYERVMMTLVSMDSPALLILPTHRVVRGVDADAMVLLDKAGRYFSVRKLDRATADSALQELQKAHAQSLVLVTHDAFYFLQARPREIERALAPLSPRQRSLDVVVLHKLLLEEILGLSEQSIREQKNVSYFRDAAEAVLCVQPPANQPASADLAFLLSPVRIEQMRDVALAGEVMPQKSTDFYPKLLSGLTIYALE